MILNKAKMAHDYAIEMLKRGDPERGIAFDAWTLADAMQAEEDKRVSKDRPEVLKDDPLKACIHLQIGINMEKVCITFGLWMRMVKHFGTIESQK